MSDDLLRNLASKAGVDATWRDQGGADHAVSIETLRAVLGSIGLATSNAAEIAESLSVVEFGPAVSTGSRFLTARVGQDVVIPTPHTSPHPIEVELENGAVRSVSKRDTTHGLTTLPPFDEPGYHRIRTGDAEFTVATAPARAVTLPELTQGQNVWGIAAQIYSLRRPSDGGAGDFGAVGDLARCAGARGADLLAISPAHAMFAAAPDHYSPYSPSNRLFYNPLLADPRAAFPDDIVREARARAVATDEMQRLEALPLIDWPGVSRARLALLRALYTTLVDPAAAGSPYRHDFDRFRTQASLMMREHAGFEVLHAHHLAVDQNQWAWSQWPAEFRDPGTAAVRGFLSHHQSELDFHLFLQWVATRSFAECQRACHDAGMRVGLIADLAVGMDPAGSHAWSRRHEILTGVAIGAPPDDYSMLGQDWGVTGFSPRGLVASGFEPFIETLRASMRYAGGVRIDHVMAMSRLWLVPNGARPHEGAYLNYPSESLFRLIALESWRHRAIVIGEDLGTLPIGFRDYLRAQGIAGLGVLRFERDAQGYRAPVDWDPTVAALTTTHDLVPTAGWWAGSDLSTPEPAGPSNAGDLENRAWDRGLLWSAFERAGLVTGARPAPEETETVVDAAVAFAALTPCQIKLLAVEDALGLRVQPNVPGTTTEKPNWRHRMPEESSTLLRSPAATRRLIMLGARDRKPDPEPEPGS